MHASVSQPLCLVTGASGFTGKYMVAELEKNGWRVHALQANITNKQQVVDEVAAVQPTHVIHLAAISHVVHADEKAFYEVNLFGTLNLLEALKTLPKAPKHVLLASSANVYGNNPNSPLSEDEPPAPVNHYAMSKLAMEHMAKLYAQYFPLTITRPFNYTGPGQDESFLIPKLVKAFKNRDPKIQLGNLFVAREFNDVRWVVQVYRELCDKSEDIGVVNICTGHVYCLDQIIDELERIYNHKLLIKFDKSLARDNEIKKLCGDDKRLSENTTNFCASDLTQLLKSMV